MQEDPNGLMPPQGMGPNGPQMPQESLSLAGGRGMPQMGGAPGGDPNAAGKTEKEVMADMIANIPIEQLIQLVSNPEDLAQKILAAAQQQGMDPDTAKAYSITLMKAIYERIQTETGKPITDFTGAPAEPQLANQPSAGLSMAENPPVGGQVPVGG